ncbi:MAG: hypothetical protein EB121_09095, partial [Alphaproteobacteria bacterium]|nr:hypothetical protein [Alphaproteobacteria bacterium]
MAWIATAIIGSAIVGGAMSSSAQKSAAKRAAAAQTQATDTATQAQLESTRLSLEEQRRQFDAIQQLFKPYVEAGGGALARQLDLTGVNGPEAQQKAIQGIQQGPEFAALTRQGEESILQSAAATGGLRGGNVQAALAKFRPEVLSSLINQQYQRLGGLTSLGQASAAGQAAQGQAFAQNASQIYGQQGNAIAAGAMNRGDIAAQLALARGQSTANMWGNIAGAVGTAAGLGLFGRGGTPAPPA